MKRTKCLICGEDVLEDDYGDLYEVWLLGGILREKHCLHCKEEEEK